MNPIGEESGNTAVTTGRDIPWLQDVDADNDNQGDNFLVAWPAVYRDVIIVDRTGEMVDSYNLTINSLEEPPSYNTLRQMLIDVSTSAIDAADDSVKITDGATSEIDVLANDAGRSRLTITDVVQPDVGVAEIATVEYPSQLDPVHWRIPELLISEIVPGDYIEMYNTSFTESVDLGSADQVLVSGSFEADIASLTDEVMAPRSYHKFDWPPELSMSWESGELVLFRDNELGYDSGPNIDDFVAWGEEIEYSRIDLARRFQQWEGEPDGTLDLGAIQRIPGTIGNESHSYDNHRPSTPGNAINDSVEAVQVIRYTPPESFEGEVELSYTVGDDEGRTDSASVRIHVANDTHPWQNPRNKLDVNNDGVVTTADAQAIIDVLNAGISGTLPTEIVVPFSPGSFVDCNGNGSVEPLDALLIIRHILTTDQDTSAAQGDPQAAAAQSNVAPSGEPTDNPSNTGGTPPAWSASVQALATSLMRSGVEDFDET